MEFRKDINGLRAIAVIAVVFYHFGLTPFHGGFVGVDIFFVISGFLITSIAYQDLQAGTFSAVQFLLKRLRRIFPALAVVTVACLIWAGFFYLPGNYNRLVRDGASVLIMRSNYILNGRTGYFAPLAEQNIFLHTWSLAVESQFYLGFAVLCGVFWPANRQRRASGAAMFVGLGLASFAWCVWRTEIDQSSAFYLLWSRAWEFMVGAGVAVYGMKKCNDQIANFLSFIGLALLCGSIFVFQGTAPYPGWRAALPVGGAALVIFARSAVVTRMLSFRFLQFIGRISYSVYLWHWPILLAFRERTGTNPEGKQVALLMLLTGVAGWLSFKFIEQPVRLHDKTHGQRRFVTASLICIAGAFSFSGAISATNGWPQRLPEYLKPVLPAMNNGNPRSTECMRTVDGEKKTAGDFCHIGTSRHNSPPTLILWGDSFADRLQPVVDQAASTLGLGGIVATQGGCPPFSGKVFKGSGAEIFSGCEHYANFVFDYFEKTPSITLAVIAGDWQRYDPDYEGGVIKKIAQILASRGGQLVLVGIVPNPREDVPQAWARRQFQAGRSIPEWTVPRSGQTDIASHGEKIVSLANESGNVINVDPFKLLCLPDQCFSVRDGQALFSDTNHLSMAGVDYLAPDLIHAIRHATEKIKNAPALVARSAQPEAWR
ncbi:acyltransferase family protein [Paraburkholderia hayleyella]|uniref:acyltransferase family protein n=1 Tax=Paraburkholderia hayleyella TaxID=2152889 RepID=UPI0012920EE9|nr:acyltransferase family protein [Paraburkholderia hayleyella]